jgi:hypothetical protein
VKLSRVLIGLVMLCSLAGAASRPVIYRNRQFGIVLPVPPGALLCAVPADAHGVEHGAQMLLGTDDATLCRKWSGKRYMDVNGFYNVSDDTKLLHDSLESLCQFKGKKACSPAPPGLHIPRMKTEAGRLDRPDGSIEIIVVTQAGKPDPDFDASVPSFQYALTLNTDSAHLSQDSALFEEMLIAIRIAPEAAVGSRKTR